jgi:flagellar hook protein FlgE
MSILTSLYTGASGMSAHGGAIGIVGDNIANVSTVGYKRSRAGFADVLGGSLRGARLGAGVRLGSVDQQFSQGSIQQTGGSLDLAIRGRGMFTVSGTHDGQAGQFYTRDGRFNLDNNGYVVDARGLRLQGYLVNGGVAATGISDLQLPGQTSAPAATTLANIGLRLDSNATPPAAPWDPANPAATSNYSTPVTVYDSLGNAHRVDLYARANGAGAWEWHAMVDGGEVTGGTAGTPTEIASGTLTFTSDGALDVETVTSSSANFLNATPGQAITWDFGDAITTDGGTGRTGTTQYAGNFSVSGLDIDGHSSGNLVDVVVEEDGSITGVFDNGDTRTMARVALAMFGDEESLQRAGDGLYAETSASGQPLLGAAGEGGRGAISSGALEGSNVELGDELVTLIAYQRAFQANVKTVTTADEMLAEVASIKR